MSGKGQWDGRTKQTHVPGQNMEFYNYVYSIMIGDDFDGELIKKRNKGKGLQKPQKEMNPDLSVVENKRVRQEFQMVRVLGELALKRLKGAFGTSFAVANPTPGCTKTQGRR